MGSSPHRTIERIRKMARRRYRDPYWTSARFASNCATCGKRMHRGDPIYYNPNRKKAYCGTCGKSLERSVLADISYDMYGTDCAFDY